jgi:hypothetical protein
MQNDKADVHRDDKGTALNLEHVETGQDHDIEKAKGHGDQGLGFVDGRRVVLTEEDVSRLSCSNRSLGIRC